MQTRTKMNFAARAGRWSAQHRKKAILSWLAFVIAATAIGGSLGTKTFVWQDNGPGEAGRAEKSIYHAFPKHAGETVLIQSRGKADPSALRTAVSDVQGRLGKVAHVSNIQSPYTHGNEGRISKDGRSVLLGFD